MPKGCTPSLANEAIVLQPLSRSMVAVVVVLFPVCKTGSRPVAHLICSSSEGRYVLFVIFRILFFPQFRMLCGMKSIEFFIELKFLLFFCSLFNAPSFAHSMVVCWMFL